MKSEQPNVAATMETGSVFSRDISTAGFKKTAKKAAGKEAIVKQTPSEIVP